MKEFFGRFTQGHGKSEKAGGPVESRRVAINDQTTNLPRKFLHNRVSTAKYTIVSFFPKFLYEQFSKYANIFFLFTSIIQQLKGISPTNPYTTILPLCVVLIATAVKEVLEDWKHHQSDKSANACYTKVLLGDVFVDTRWRDVKVGDIVRIDGSEPFPADLVLLSSSEPEGLCYIETCNLDGETNLKIKQSRPETAEMTSPSDISRLEGELQCEQPNNSLYTFEGTLRRLQPDGGIEELPLDPQQILLRGAVLRNTTWVYGLVIYTGHETKLMRNAAATPIKRTSVERMTNVQILFLFALLIILSVSCAAGAYYLQVHKASELRYTLLGSNFLDFLGNILTFIILFNNLIPISLIVTMEVVKFQQSALINSDLDMYYEPTDTPALARTSSLVEELGQIEYIFTDKTGTLTRNIMEFRECSIAGLPYAETVDSSRKAREVDGEVVGVYDFLKLRDHLGGAHASHRVIDEFLILLAVCHTVIPERKGDNSEITYQASSPDEAALVAGAAGLGYRFITRKPRTVSLEVTKPDGRVEEETYEILQICEFNSTRKRMSAVVRCPDGKVRVYCKGADTVILERLAQNNPFVDATLRHLEEYATEGLRTLCLAVREIPEPEYEQWSALHHKASISMNDRADELDRVAELIEKDLFLLGATAVEDKLQEGVPETIHTLAQASIKMWVLTGDRQETAINIGYSCKLLQEDMSLMICNEDSHWETKDFLEKKLSLLRPSRSGLSATEPLALIIDGHTLKFALEKDIELLFLELACMCKAVVCCRVSPLQKALVVKLVKKHKKAILLAIGDGANDVSMIQAAHVGVGIAGMEGMQAARAADFAIGQFRFLRKLLLVHGAWSYHRLSKLILYSFYKNICLYMTQFWFSFYNGFSGQVIYESWTISAYNVLLTVLPPLVIGIFDQYLSARMLDRYPELYVLGQKSEFFNVRTFWAWAINGFAHSLILFFAAVALFGDGDFILTSGRTAGHWFFGTTLYTAVVLTVLLKAALVTDHWTKPSWMAIPGSFLFWMVFFVIFGILAPMGGVATEYDGLVPVLYGSRIFWLFIIVTPIFCLLRDYAWKFAKRMYLPRAYHYIQEIQKYNIPDYRPRMERFRNAVHKVRMIQRMKRNRGYAFSQNDEGEEKLIRAYDTTLEKPRG
ncbi:hypothetical protein BJ684DRAFT_7889 [Piptocephalis cylindrospora]|uniref:Phospholipid-transporting ATPase n=1 Tax=Piptocephalis cylindrospora TaxID=1907219 RepID=A0A4P9YA18_9FUNG|nr:hypothetical protein BJ684DRAFT_7889 [Piptocephalis cylindrospora]|eukprot:RKP14890.1 hypothetical protein BJ684DRAFT_7889 [Piptocephalis cylindrospora]